jgi:hypothetical protein
MFVAIERLLIRRRQPASRADELIELRRRMREELATSPDLEERAAAAAVQEQKLRVAGSVTDVQSCSSCAVRQPFPTGHFAGGACCAGTTAILFDPDELGALAHAGARAADLVAPVTDHAGCAFRGATGCTLAVETRPARCIHYFCETLRGELHRRGELDALEASLAELDRRMQAYRATRKTRTDREVLAPLLDAIRDAKR